MNVEHYQKQALATLNPQLTHEQVIFMCTFGIIGEAGEVTDYLKKQLFHQMRPVEEILADPVVQAKMCDELGDLIWYLAVLAHTLNIPIALDRFVDPESLEKEILYLASNVGFLVNRVREKVSEENTDRPIKDYLRVMFICLIDLSSLFGLTLEIITEANITKLKERHTQGFTNQYASDSTSH